MQSLGQIGGAIGTGASAVGNAALQGAQKVGQAFLGGGQQQGDFMGPMQQLSGLQKIAPYFSDLLQGQGIGSQLLGGMAGDEGGGYDTGVLGSLLRKDPMSALPQFANPMQGLLQGVVGPGSRFVQGMQAPRIEPKAGIIQGLINSYTGGLVGGHSGY